MLSKTLNTLFQREIVKLITELNTYQSEVIIWEIEEGISNSAGNLTLHLIGNLNTYFGKNIGNTGYVRDRPAEFSAKNIPREKLIDDLKNTALMLEKVFTNFDNSLLETTYPEKVFDYDLTHEQFFVHLISHFNYHLGQVNYHRRLLDR
jgi:hypothetical protein